MKNQKGITLVALIITIIVMLILVAVSITIALNGGLFDTTKKAAGDTKNAINEEGSLSNGKVNIDGNEYNITEYANINTPGGTTTPEGNTTPSENGAD